MMAPAPYKETAKDTKLDLKVDSIFKDIVEETEGKG